MEGGSKMDVRFEKKEKMTLVGKQAKFSYENAFKEIPKFWDIFNRMNKCNMKENNIGKYGVCIDGEDGETEFRYLIAGDYNGEEKCDGATIVEIPSYTWAIFKCVGPMPDAIQDLNSKIFKEWIPKNKEYEIAAGYNIEMYNSGDCSASDYVSEIWIPIKIK